MAQMQADYTSQVKILNTRLKDMEHTLFNVHEQMAQKDEQIEALGSNLHTRNLLVKELEKQLVDIDQEGSQMSTATERELNK